jgi:hypothetical protein
MNESIGHSLPERLYLKSYHKSMRPIIVFSLLRSIISSTMTDRRQRTIVAFENREPHQNVPRRSEHHSEKEQKIMTVVPVN